MTVDAIVNDTRAKLSSSSGQANVRRMDGYVDIIARARHELEIDRARFHLRPNTTATINIGQARSLTFSICVRGVTCGMVRVDSDGTAKFEVKANKKFAPLDEQPRTRWTPWRANNVREYLDRCDHIAAREFMNREQALQSEFLREMIGRSSGTKTQLRDFQPVTLAGVPIQLPTPVKPRGKEGSNGFGHLDVLARHLKGRLAVFELKQPGGGAGAGALRQAEIYAASYGFLMCRDEARPKYWAAFGSKRKAHLPRFHAYAVVCEEDGAALLAEWNELEQSNQARMTLGVFVYSRKDGRTSFSSLSRR